MPESVGIGKGSRLEMDYGVLGQLEVRRGGEVLDLGSQKQRALLALLLIHRNQVISTDRIIDEIWGEEPGSDRKNALHVYLSNLRKVLEPDRTMRGGGTVLLTRSPGYVLKTEVLDVDSDRFEASIAEARALIGTDPGSASIILGEALALWRGHAYEEFIYESFAQGERARLDELRLEAIELRVDADLARGLSRELVSELEALVRENPLRERLAGQLMVALYRSGRQAEALRAYSSLKERLVDELGIEPSAEIQSLEERIVLGDPSLQGPDHVDSPGGGQPVVTVRGYELRERIGSGVIGMSYRAFQPSVGREVAVKVVQPEVADDPSFIRTFEDEAQLIARLNHPAIVPLYDYWREPGAGYLVSRLMQGGSLADLLANGPLEPGEVARIVTRVADALDTAHRAGVVHGDVKPANILLDADGNAFLSGFAFKPLDGGLPHAIGARSVSGHLAPEVWDGGPPTRASDVFGLGVVAAAAVAGRTGDPGDLMVGIDAQVGEVLSRATSLVPEQRHQSAGSFAAELLEAIEYVDPDAVVTREARNPYKGLRPFQAADAVDFFGRERLVERLLARLGNSGRLGRFVALVGPSGSGKSSAVRAGLIPALRRDGIPGASTWYQIEMTPGLDPFASLEEAMLGVAVNPPPSLLDELLAERGIVRAVDRIIPDPDAQLLIVIDQFEELYTSADPSVAEKLLEAILETIRSDRGRIRFVVTLRADFYDRPLSHPEFGELLRQGTEVVTPMTAGEVEMAIAGPARAVGVEYEPAVVAEIINDVARRPGSLPLLQYALTEIFEHRRGSTITSLDYQTIGGVAGALGDRAESLFNSLDPESRPATREVFLRLVTLGEGNEDTRRRVLLNELSSLGETSRHVDTIVQAFGRHRLLSFDRDPVSRGPTVEISHEALLSEWPRLRRWIDESRSDVRAERRLAVASGEWSDRDQDEGYLFTGSRLARYDGWVSEAPVAITETERRFLLESYSKQQASLEAERTRVEESERLKRRSRLLVGLGFVTILVVGLALFALYERQRSQDLASEVSTVEAARRLVGSSSNQVNADPELALLLSIEAARATADLGFVIPEAMDSIHSAIQAMGLQYATSSDTAFAVRDLGSGPGGVFLMAPDELARFALEGTTRSFSTEECQIFLSVSECPTSSTPALPAGLEVRGGYEPAAGDRPFAGTRVVLLAPFSEGTSEIDGLTADMAEISEGLGIQITIAPPPAGVSPWDAVRRGEEADLVLLPQPGALQSLMVSGDVMDISNYLDPQGLIDAYGQHLVDLTSVAPDGTWPSSSGPVGAIWIKIDSKSVIWHGTSAEVGSLFDTPPKDWSDLMRLSRDLVSAGETPWCTGVLNNPANGWPATDTVENIIIRSEGPEFYDRWTRHEVPFDDPAVAAAVQKLTDLVYTEGFVSPGPSIVVNRWSGDAAFLLAGTDPAECWMLHFPSFLPTWHVGMEAGRNLDLFDFPVINPEYATATVGGGGLVAQVKDRPEVRAVLKAMASPDFGRNLAATGAWILPHRQFDLDNYPNPVDRRVAASLQTALDDGTFRFDASDLMPPEIGLGAFGEGLVSILASGPDTIEDVLAAIDAEWIALEESVSENG